VTDRPSMIVLRSHIAYPSPNKVDTSAAHGEPLGAEEVEATKAVMGFPAGQAFHIPDGVLEMYRAAGRRHSPAVDAWSSRVAALPDALRAEFDACLAGLPMPGWADRLPTYEAGKEVATRQASGDCLNALLPAMPGLIGGGADLTGNTGTMLKGATKYTKATPEGRLIHYGVREHGMGAIMNGIAAHGGLLPFGGTFFVFSDYMRGAVRVAAVSECRVVYSWTHDSIGVGEDGPTHQPIEHLASLRPADGNEVAAAWRVVMESGEHPIALVLSRQKVPVLNGTSAKAARGVPRGAYVLEESASGDPDIVLLGTGSEVQHCVGAARVLRDEGYDVQVVSMPSWDLFEAQDEDYQESVLPMGVPVVAVEMGSSFGWERYADLAVTVDTFGASGAAEKIIEEFGFDADSVVEAALLLLEEDDQ
jgi:transketolase